MAQILNSVLDAIGSYACALVAYEGDVPRPGHYLATDSGNNVSVWGATSHSTLMLARLEGLLFDPVYSGKALAGMIDLIRNDFLGSSDIVFLHTGGAAALFAYADQLQT